MKCPRCGWREVNEAQAAKDHDAGVPLWDHCAPCAKAELGPLDPEPPDGFPEEPGDGSWQDWARNS